MTLIQTVSATLALALAGSVLCAALGLVLRLHAWLRAPGHPRFALAPAPFTRRGVTLRLLREGLLFESLWRASPGTWLLGWPFHLALAVIAVQHLRYVTPTWWPWVERVAAWGPVASGVLLLSLLGLWARRMLVARVRHVSRPSDHLWLILLLVIAASGAALKYAMHTDVVAVKGFVRALMSAQLQSLPVSPLLWLHLLLASVVFALFPFSKLLHGAAVWVNPTRASRAPVGHGRP